MRFRINFNGCQISDSYPTLRAAALARKIHPDEYKVVWIQEWVDGGYDGEPKIWVRVSEARYLRAAGLERGGLAD